MYIIIIYKSTVLYVLTANYEVRVGADKNSNNMIKYKSVLTRYNFHTVINVDKVPLGSVLATTLV